MQLSGDVERTLAVREMFKEWMGRYPTPREVIWHYRKSVRTEMKTRDERIMLEAPVPHEDKPADAVRSGDAVEPEAEVRHETVVERWFRRERAKPWFERN